MIPRQNSPYKECHKILEDEGAVILSDFFDQQEVVTLQNTIQKFFKVATQEQLHKKILSSDIENSATLYLLYQAIGKSSALHFLTQKLAAFTQNHLVSDPVINIDSNVLFGLPRDKRLAHEWHQEAPYYPGLNNAILTFWFPVMEQSSLEIGTMSILKGTQKLGLLPYKLHQKINGFTELIPEGISEIEASFTEHLCTLAIGDVLLFHQHTIHRSNWNQSDRTRFTGSIRFASLTNMPDRISNFSEVYGASDQGASA